MSLGKTLTVINPLVATSGLFLQDGDVIGIDTSLLVSGVAVKWNGTKFSI